MVVAYALAGKIDIDMTRDPIGVDKEGEEVFLKDLWPTMAEVNATMSSCIDAVMFKKQYSNVGEKNEQWNAIPIHGGELFEWDPRSTYIQEPPFFINLAPQASPIRPIAGARVLVMVGDSVTTDHISPAGNIKKDSPAGRYLLEHGVPVSEFNQYGSRRGADQVMTRGTFANIRLKNLLVPGTEGGITRYLPTGEVMSIFDAAMKYKESHTPLIVLAGKDYGMGSSRDWAAKGTMLLGVKAVIAESLERIHRSNLVGMGVLPLVFVKGESRCSLGLSGEETYDIVALDDSIKPMQRLQVIATAPDGKRTEFTTVCRIDTPVELEYYRNGGILQTVLRRILRGR
jgi:aconitate hydratase